MSDDRMLTLAEAGAMLGLSAKAVLERVLAGRLVGYDVGSGAGKPGRHGRAHAWRVSRASVRRYLDACKVRPRIQPSA